MIENPNLEMNFLGCCMLTQDCLDYAMMTGVKYDWFGDRFHQTLWTEMVRATAEGLVPDLVWAGNKFPKYATRLAHMVGDVLTITAFTSYVELLRRNHHRRQFANTLTDFQRRMYSEDPLPMMNQLIEQLAQIKSVNQPETQGLEERIGEIIMRDVGISTGFRSIDYMTKGFEPGIMWVIGGHTSHGKSMLTVNMCFNVAKQKKPVSYISSEMRDDQFYMRLTTVVSGLNRSRIKFNAVSYKAYMDKLKEVMTLPITFHYSTSLTEIRAIIQQGKSEVYFVDYLQDIHPEHRTKDRRQDIGDTIRALEELSKYHRVCIVVLSQFHRPFGKDRETTPTLHSFKESGEIENAADIACLLWYKYASMKQLDEKELKKVQDELEEEKGILRLEIAKNRIHDHTGVVVLEFHKDKCLIEDGEEEHEG